MANFIKYVERFEGIEGSNEKRELRFINEAYITTALFSEITGVLTIKMVDTDGVFEIKGDDAKQALITIQGV